MAEQLTVEQRLEALEASNVKKDEIIGELKNQLAGVAAQNLQEQKPLTIPTEPVEHKGKSYMWTAASFILKGETYTAEEASLNEALITKILAIKGQGLLREKV